LTPYILDIEETHELRPNFVFYFESSDWKMKTKGREEASNTKPCSELRKSQKSLLKFLPSKTLFSLHTKEINWAS